MAFLMFERMGFGNNPIDGDYAVPDFSNPPVVDPALEPFRSDSLVGSVGSIIKTFKIFPDGSSEQTGVTTTSKEADEAYKEEVKAKQNQSRSTMAIIIIGALLFFFMKG